MAFLKRHKSACILAGCYILGLLVWLALHTGQYIDNKAAYKSGKLATAELSLELLDYNEDIVMLDDGTLLTIGADPQLLFKNGGLYAENITLDFTYSRQPGPVNVFWKKDEQSYSLRNMAYPVKPEAGQNDEDEEYKENKTETKEDKEGYIAHIISSARRTPHFSTSPPETDPIPTVQHFFLPAAGVGNIRIDPGTSAGTTIKINSISINSPRSFGEFYRFSASEVVLLLVLPALLACVLSAALHLNLRALLTHKREVDEQ